MVPRTAPVSVQQDEYSGGGEPISPAPETSHSSPATSSEHHHVVRCPSRKCPGLLTVSERDYNFHSGLETWVCNACGHRGFRSREGVIHLFRGGYEFKFSYGPSTQTITVVLSSAAVNLWGTHGVNDEHLAKMAAEWTLLCGNTTTPVNLGLPSEEFADFYLYFCGD
ncbi:MAG TPA: hypothetical protein DCQ94_17550 [Nitrospira sp.]|jgi:hypothetical protein|nr:hypothetical protein [Nitrospira sp.]